MPPVLVKCQVPVIDKKHILLERTSFRKIFRDPKIGLFFDVTAHRISLIRAYLYFPWEKFQLELATSLSKIKTKQNTFCEFCEKSNKNLGNHETFQNIDLVLGFRQMMIR